MKTKKTIHLHTTHFKHLTDEEVAFCAQELILERYADSVPDHIQSHLDSCYTCFTNVQDFFMLLDDEPGLIDAIFSEELTHISAPEAKSENRRFSITLQNSLFRWLAVAASVLVLATGAFFVFTQSGADPQALFTQYYKPYHDVVTTKSIQNDQNLLNGLFYYNTGEYRQAIIHFTNGLKLNPNDPDLLFYLAGSHLALGDFGQAIAIYELLHTTSSGYQSPVKWYLALSYLAGNKTVEARALLKSISDEGGFYAEDAEKILRKL